LLLDAASVTIGAPIDPRRQFMAYGAIAGLELVDTAVEARDVLASHDIRSDLHFGASRELIGGNVNALSGDEHARRRRIEAVLFTRGPVERYENDVLVPALNRRLAERIAARRDDGLVGDDLIDLARAALIPMISALIGIDGVVDAAAVATIHRYSEVFGEGASSEFAMDDRESIMRRALEAKAEFAEHWFRPSLERRRAALAAHEAGTGDEPPVDLLSQLARDVTLTEQQMLNEVVFFFVASSSTTSHSMPHVMTELWRWVDAHPGEEERLGDAVFLRDAAAEALRLHPVVPALIRKTLCPVELSTGRRLPPETRVAVDLNACNRDETIVEGDPATFDPDRAMRGTPRWAYAFGIGPHTCLGRSFAIGGPNAGTAGGRATIGAVPRLVQELLAVGIAPDPAAPPPVLRTDTASDRYAAFPVVFRGL
jgi:cytochrome P450